MSAAVDVTQIESSGFTKCVLWGLSDWGNKVKKGGSIKGDCRTFYPSFLCYCEISWKALFAGGVGEAGALTAIPYLHVERKVLVGGQAQKKQVQAQVTLTSTVSSGDGGPSA